MNSPYLLEKTAVKRSSLSRRFSITLSIVVAAILLFFSVIVVLFNYYTIERKLNKQLADTLALAETSLPTAVWQMDYSSMNDILEAILINTSIASVRIFTDGVIAAGKSQVRFKDEDFSFFKNSDEFSVQSIDVKRLDEKVGVFEVAISRADMKRDLITTILAVAALALILCSAILFTSVLITRQYIFKPLLKLETHAKMIAAGNLESNIEITGNDEFSHLAEAFNSMANQLKISFDTLEQKVRERTADLYKAKTEAEKINLSLGIAGAELKALLDNSPVGILFLDFNRVVQRVNPEITRITGYEEGDLVGKTTRKLYPSEESYQNAGALSYPALHKHGYYQVNDELLKRDGTPVMCYMRGRVIVAKSGGLEGVVWSLEDITMRLKMEEELLKIKKLESISVLAGGIAHDFNNLLLAIIGNISLAQRLTADDMKVSDILLSAHKASKRAKDLTAKLLTFASGGEPIKATESLPQLLQDSASFVLSGSNVKCVYTFCDKLWPVNMDKTQINQVIQNLVVNADQSMPDGGLIRISCDNVLVHPGQIPGLENGRYVCVSVEDQGMGISKNNIGRVFDPYFSTKKKDSNKGSGLGLAIVHSIITKHNGKIVVASKPGEGSTFTLYLPAIPDQRIDSKEQGDSLCPGRGHILIMDDEEMIRKVVCDMLVYLGYETAAAADGEEAIAIYENCRARGHRFDAVIMDLTIPGGMGGAEAVAQILALDPTANVIVSSGYSHDPILDDFHAFGFCNIVTKPYNLLELSRVLSETLTS